MELKPGTRLRSQVGPTEVVVVKSPGGDLGLACGGQPMIPAGDAPAEGLTVAETAADSTLLGKRYTDPDDRIELLVTKPGVGTLVLDGVGLGLKQAKPLPASD